MKKLIFAWICLLLTIPCRSDTFTHRKTGEVLHGYATQIKKGNKTLIRVGDKKKPHYLNLVDYDIEWNHLGRRNQVIVLPIKNEIELECETEAFIKALDEASNQGPILILIEIDTPGGRVDLMQQICTAITKANNCPIVAFVSGDKWGGAYSAGASIALACDYIYMSHNTAIGAATTILASPSDVNDIKSVYGETAGEKFMSASRAYIAAIAEQNNRPSLLAQAMVDKDIEVLEVIEKDKTVFIAPENLKVGQPVRRIWSKRGSLLTLTATEAVKCGIADKVVDSLKGLISDLDLLNARFIHNDDVIKARRKFELANQKLEKTLNDIDLYKKKIDTLSEHAYFLHGEYMKLMTEWGRLWDRSHGKDTDRLLKKIRRERRLALYDLSNALKNIIPKYSAVIALKKSHPDLQVDIAALNEEINSAKAQLEKARAIY